MVGLEGVPSPNLLVAHVFDLAGVRRGGEPDLWVEISIKIVFFKD
jgi:hypothetical protein